MGSLISAYSDEYDPPPPKTAAPEQDKGRERENDRERDYEFDDDQETEQDADTVKKKCCPSCWKIRKKSEDDEFLSEGSKKKKKNDHHMPPLPSSSSLDHTENLERPKLCCSARLLLSLAGFVNFFNIAYVRIAISIAFICMVQPTHMQDSVIPRTESDIVREFTWSSATKGWLTSAAFYGFIFGPCIGGFLSFKYGGKLVLLIGTSVTGVGYLFLPEAARLSPAVFFAIRMVTGFFCGFNFPAYFDLVSHWIVPEETQLLVSGALVGIPAASIFIFPMSAMICKTFGWVWLFYLMGVWLLCCAVIFYFIIFNYPDSCPFISEREQFFIQTRLPKHTAIKIPWTAMLKSTPIYAYIVIHFCVSYVYLSIVLTLPMFMEEVHHFTLSTNGFLSALPFLGSIIIRILLSFFFEPVRLKLKLSKNTLRKTLTFCGAVLVATFLLVTTRISSHYRYFALTSLILAVTSFELCVTGGYLLSLLDLCPSYVNILTGLTNTIANSAGLIGPVVNGLITADPSVQSWNIVFYVNISLMLFSMAFYLIFGKNELLSWGRATNVPDEDPANRVSIAAT